MSVSSDWGNEAISALRDGLKKTRAVGVVPEHSANLPDRKVQPVLEVYVSIRSPHLLSQLFARDNFPGATSQN